jgi:uncharacterized membrane protein
MAYQWRLPGLANGQIAAIGVIAAGAALLEAALLPGLALGGAALLAPKVLPKLRRRLKPLFTAPARQQTGPAVRPPGRSDAKLALAAPARLRIKQAVLKTVTFRIIVTTVDFTTNYVVLGELTTAAGLSAVSFVAGPIFYFVHETGWNFLGPTLARKLGRRGIAIDHPVLVPFQPDAKAPLPGWGGITISRALAKTITFRVFATAMDFTVNYVVTGELATAAKLSAIGFVIGPFVYLGHERFWDHYGSPKEEAARGAKDDVAGLQKLLPAPSA